MRKKKFTVFQMASAIEKDERTHTFRAFLTKSSNDSYNEPEHFWYEAKWSREMAPSSCGHTGHYDSVRDFSVTGKKSMEEAVEIIYQLHLLPDSELNDYNSKEVEAILYPIFA